MTDLTPVAKSFATVRACDVNPQPDYAAVESRWFEQLRKIRHRLQRWLPAVMGLPLWSDQASELTRSIETLQRCLCELSEAIVRLSDPAAPANAADFESMEASLAVVGRSSRQLEAALIRAASPARYR